MKRIIFLLLITLIANSCAFRSGMMLSKYPVEVFWDKTEPNKTYDILGDVKLSDEKYYSTKSKNAKKELLTHYGTLPKGYEYDEKEILIYQLTKKAKEMGADAIMGINYQLSISQDKYGYNLSCIALKYK